MIPFLDLSIRIAQKGHCISFVSTPKKTSTVSPTNLPPHFPDRSRSASKSDYEDKNPAWQSIKEWLDKKPKLLWSTWHLEAMPSLVNRNRQKSLLDWKNGSVLKTRQGPFDPNPIELPQEFEPGWGFVWTTWAR
ncbi:unnamed protein product [Citrullus colocynthis]|uniref:Uncharacterized protein n=1 Tax=Citrullus colocynthis TaxID=252529 RepID=A0ABP0YJ84_9ROSI